MMECQAPDMAPADELHLISLEVSAAADAYSLALEERTKIGRHPRWSRHETLFLIEAKMVEEAKWSKVKEERERGIETARANSDSKWLSISHYCERLGVVRSAAQCRKRWCNLSADYKRIRDWQSLRGKQSFWLMGSDARKDNKLPGCFDREVFESLDKTLGKHPCVAPEIIFDSGRQGIDDGLFSDIEHPLAEEDISVSPVKEMESPPIESLTPTQASRNIGYAFLNHPEPPVDVFDVINRGVYEEKFIDEKFRMDVCDDICEEKPSVLAGTRKKRKRPSVCESDDFRGELFALLENNSKILTAHVDSQNLNSHLDRTQRKEHAESLVGVLGKLADALGKIADKL